MSIAILGETLSYLRFNCIWPTKDQELNPDKYYHVKLVLMLLSSPIILIGSTLHLIVSLKSNSNNISEDLIMMIAEVGVYYFIAIFVGYQKQIAQIYVDLSDFTNFEKPQNFDKVNRRLSLLSKMYKSFIDFAIINVCLSPFVSKRFCEKLNQEREFKEICGLLATTWMPFNIDVFPIKQIFFLLQLYTVVFTMKGAAVISFAIMETIEHLVLRIKHLKLMLNEAVSTEDVTTRQQRFAKCIEYHINIFDIGKRIDEHYTMCLFLHVLLTGALFGCIGYRSMETFSLDSLAIFFAWLMSLCIVCVSGQHLIDEAFSVADTAYNSEWYRRDVSFQKSIQIVMMRSQNPIVVHAGPFTYVSHVTILTVRIFPSLGATPRDNFVAGI
ncbi:odorant receptor 4-like isoform X3 [Tenebrio molitor]|uniref:odorant receptor 4-like isoform X3 n=1 Tax=Tenebrio molitor TaxID=7067 RepID=UPI0036247101